MLKKPVQQFLTCLVLLMSSQVYAVNAQLVGGDLTVFHDWPNNQDRTFVIIHSVEQRVQADYLDQVKAFATSLERWGFKHAQGSTPATLMIFFKVGIEPKEIELPIDNQTFQSASLWAQERAALKDPMQAAAPPTHRVYRVQQRQLNVIISTTQGKRLYESRLISQGNSGSILEILPSLVDLMMQQFPGKNGATWWVQVPFRQ